MKRNISKEADVINILSTYKWRGKFCCVRCGADQLMKSRDVSVRRCLKCKKPEGLTKYTALEHLRIPLVTAYRIITFLVDNLRVDTKKKIIPYGRGNKERIRDADYISIEQYIKNNQKAGKSAAELDEELTKIIRNIPPSMRQLSIMFGLEENSIAKLVGKLASRIPQVEVDETETPYEQLYRFIDSNQHRPLEFFLSWIMTPLVGHWQYGQSRIGNIHLSFLPSDRELWDVWQIENALENDDVFTERQKISSIEYGSYEWCTYFVEELPPDSESGE